MLKMNGNPIEFRSTLSKTVYDTQLFERLLGVQFPQPRAVEIKSVYYNDRHTTIVWSDGGRTTVGCMDGEPFDEYAGFAAAIVKRMFGSSREAKRFLDKHKVVQQVKPKKIKAEEPPKLEEAKVPLLLNALVEEQSDA